MYWSLSNGIHESDTNLNFDFSKFVRFIVPHHILVGFETLLMNNNEPCVCDDDLYLKEIIDALLM